ncbi:UNVERIFIED_CONTAM: hypothetical protein FKN15_076369 [Acipenser sinensis]
MWGDGAGIHTIRDLKYTIENPRHFIDSLHQKPVNAVIEHVRDGAVVRALLLPDYYLVTVMLSGIKCPSFKREPDGQEIPEPFAAEAKFFTESRLLQRDVQIILESCPNQVILGTILHPNGNITELLLKDGFARCVDWSIAVYTQGADKLRAAERYAKERKVRIWKDYVAPTANLDQKDKQFVAKVRLVLNALKVDAEFVYSMFLVVVHQCFLPSWQMSSQIWHFVTMGFGAFWNLFDNINIFSCKLFEFDYTCICINKYRRRFVPDFATANSQTLRKVSKFKIKCDVVPREGAFVHDL